MGWDYDTLPKRIKEKIDRSEHATTTATPTAYQQTIFIRELPPGLNGSKGLMQLHWRKYQKLKDKWVLLMQSKKPKTHSGRVNIRYTRKSVQMMDFDNLAASFKPVGDALEACGVIEDDSPATINKFEVRWEKADTYRSQGVRIEISNVE